MNSGAILKTELINELDMLPNDKIAEIKDYVEFLHNKVDSDYKKNSSLNGIWKESGFEDLDGLDAEITD